MPDRPLSILIAPATFKGTLSAPAVAKIMADVLGEALGDSVALTICPVADGGDDTLDVLQAVEADWVRHTVKVTGPLPDMQVKADYLWHTPTKTALIEAAQAHGLKLMPEGKLAPLKTTSYGVGELVKAAMTPHDSVAPETVMVSLGGSASTDGGIGALQALGVRFLDESGALISEPLAAQDLLRIHRVEPPKDWPYKGRLLIATDVVNPLLGKEGTATVFAPQKGADKAQCAELETALTRLNQQLSAAFEADYSTLPGAGAAGGLAYGLRHLPRSGIVFGSQWLAERLGLPEKIRQADVIITGEGHFDATSLGGKAVGNILATASAETPSKPVFILCGKAESGLQFSEHVQVYQVVNDTLSAEAAMADPSGALRTRLNEMLPTLQRLR